VERRDIRLQRYLAQCGVASRRECETFISSGRVLVNGQPAKLGDSVDPSTDAILLDGRPVNPERHVYILLNKAPGVVTTAKDTHGRKTVLDALSGLDERVFPVGRLDFDVEGALLLTNDGELANRLTHPRFRVDKVYEATVRGNLTLETAARLKQGIQLEDGLAKAERVTVLQRGRGSTRIRLVMREGRKREVKRLCAAAGHRVRHLKRTAIGTLKLTDLKPGQWRRLTDEEVQSLRELTGLDSPDNE
jgi:pseudouridine synthase